jgi:polyisoprenoid-binding protein YceI
MEEWTMSVLEQAAVIPAGSYSADPAHSSVEFGVRHMGLATIRGRAASVSATLDATSGTPVIEGVIDATSLTTFDEQRDGHLASPEFFDTARFPEISFRSTGLLSASDGSSRLAGELTIKGVTKPIELTATVTGSGTDPWGNERVGLDVEGVLNRTDFGVSWNAPLPGGGFLLNDDVQLIGSFSFVKQG